MSACLSALKLRHHIRIGRQRFGALRRQRVDAPFDPLEPAIVILLQDLRRPAHPRLRLQHGRAGRTGAVTTRTTTT